MLSFRKLEEIVTEILLLNLKQKSSKVSEFLRLSWGNEASLVVVQCFPICGMRCNISTKLPYCTLTDDLTASS